MAESDKQVSHKVWESAEVGGLEFSVTISCYIRIFDTLFFGFRTWFRHSSVGNIILSKTFTLTGNIQISNNLNYVIKTRELFTLNILY